MADKIVVLRAGRVEQVGPPLELYNNPCNRFVAGFIGSPQMNFLEGRIVDGAIELPGLGVVRTRARLPAGGTPVSIGIRPEHIHAGHQADNNLTGAVAGVEQLGGLSYVRLAGPDITIQIPGQTRLAAGAATPIHFPTDAIHVFDADGLTLPRLS